MLIGLSGYAGSGKDRAAKALTDGPDRWVRLAFADAVKDSLFMLNPFICMNGWSDRGFGEIHPRLQDVVNEIGWDNAKQIPEVRRLLQRMGTEAGRYVHGMDCWVRYLETRIVMHAAVETPMVVTDVRFANEAEMIRRHGGKVYRIERVGVGPVNGHVSEALDFEVDGVIENNGTIAELHNKILALANGVSHEGQDTGEGLGSGVQTVPG